MMIDLRSTVGTDGTVDAEGLRAAFGQFPSGVTAVCALDGDTPLGIAASSFVGVSMDPPLVGVCVQHTSTTWPRLRELPRFGLSVLSDTQDAACRRLAAKTGDRFAGVTRHHTDEGALFLEGATAWLDCAIERTILAGDHDLVLFRVHRQCVYPDHTPLVFHASGFHALVGLEPES
jgi:flavin reductase (DIM6/NTAB) family NADH-FMN oxidoreductase RutF